MPSSEERGNALKKHTFYTISGTDKHGSFIIERRFSEFEALRRILLERWPGCFVPTLSDKTDIKNENLKNTHKRKHLQQFLMKIALSEFIYYKEEVQLFLRSVGMDMNDVAVFLFSFSSQCPSSRSRMSSKDLRLRSNKKLRPLRQPLTHHTSPTFQHL